MAAKKERTSPERTSAQRAAQPKKAPKTTRPPATSTFSGNAEAEVSPEELRKLISEAAYFRAQQRGFAPGYELEDWIQAEAEVMQRLNRAGA